MLYNIYSDVQKNNGDLSNFTKMTGKLEKKLDIQSYELGNNFETLMKNHGEVLYKFPL